MAPAQTKLAVAPNYIPHRGPMLMVDTISRLDRDAVTGDVEAKLRSPAPYFQNGRFAAHWLVEMAAQASAAIYNAVRSDGSKPSPFGYLVSIRDFKLASPLELKPGDDLVFSVVFEVQMQPFGQSHCLVKIADRSIAEGNLTFFAEAQGDGY